VRLSHKWRNTLTRLYEVRWRGGLSLPTEIDLRAGFSSLAFHSVLSFNQWPELLIGPLIKYRS